MPNGFINLYKNKGISSNKALSIVKRRLKENNVLAKVGHFGTLDPLAEGVLPIAIGRATRLFDYMQEKVKVYKAEFTFGMETDTLDLGGDVTRTDSSAAVTESDIENALPKLIGEIYQMPPKYSAKNIGGKRAYDLARKGEMFTLSPKKVSIYEIVLLEKLRENVFTFRISCGGGTYIRAIARDMAQLVGTVGLMSGLIREQSGKFTLDSSVRIEDIPQNIESIIIPIEEAAKDMHKLLVTPDELKWLKDGKKLKKEENGFFPYALFCDGIFSAIADINNGFMEVKTWLL